MIALVRLNCERKGVGAAAPGTTFAGECGRQLLILSEPYNEFCCACEYPFCRPNFDSDSGDCRTCGEALG